MVDFKTYEHVISHVHRLQIPTAAPPPLVARNCAQPHSWPTLATFIVNQGVSRAGQGSVRQGTKQRSRRPPKFWGAIAATALKTSLPDWPTRNACN